MKRLMAGAVLAVILAPWLGLAQSKDRKSYMIYGVGVQSCGELTTFLKRSQGTPSDLLVTSWLSGYLTGAGEVLFDQKPSVVLAENDVVALRTWLDQWCSNHPLDKVSDAASNLLIELKRRRQENR